jgi:hypothetical protein
VRRNGTYDPVIDAEFTVNSLHLLLLGPVVPFRRISAGLEHELQARN